MNAKRLKINYFLKSLFSRRQALKAFILGMLGITSGKLFVDSLCPTSVFAQKDDESSGNKPDHGFWDKLLKLMRKIFTGSGSPEGTVSASPGSIYLRDDYSIGPVFWVKRSGTGNSGWREVTSLEIINVKDFGAIGDGVTDDTKALQAALDTGSTSMPVYIPTGTYRISAPLDISYKSVFGVHHWRPTERGTIIKVADNISVPYVLISQNNPFQIKNIIIDGNGRAEFGLHTNNVGLPTTLICNISVTGSTTAGFYFQKTMLANIEALTAKNNKGNGFVIEDCNGSNFFNLRSVLNAGIGVLILAKDNSGGVYLLNCNAESNNNHALVINGISSTCVIDHFWIENNYDGVRVDGAHLVNIRNCRISGFGDGKNRAINLIGNTGDCIIEGNSASRSGGDPNYARIEIEAGCKRNVIIANSHLLPYGSVPIFYNGIQIYKADPSNEQRMIY